MPVSLSGNHTFTTSDMGRRIIVVLSAAADLVLPVFEKEMWVEFHNDASSTNDATVKTSGGSTVVVLPPGEKSGPITSDTGNAPEPPL